MRSRPHVRFKAGWEDPYRIHPKSGGHKLILTLPDLPDHAIKQCHGFLRELLLSFEEHYEHQLARAYRWTSCPYEDEQEEPDDEEEDEF